MSASGSTNGQADAGSEAMQEWAGFKAFAQQLKTPLIEIANEAELQHSTSMEQIRETAAQTLEFIDAYLLSREQQSLPLETVSISAVLYDAAELLRPLAKQHGCELELDVDGRYGPVMAHREGLQAALVTLGQNFLSGDSSVRPQLTMAVYRTQDGLAAGVFGRSDEWEAKSLRRTLSQSASDVGAGLHVARNIIQRMASDLHVTQHHKLTGVAAQFPLSAQLRIV